MDEKIARYIELKELAKSCEAEIKELQPEILEYVKELNPEDNEVVIEGAGRFTVEKRKKYEYPLAIQEQEEVLDAAKAEAIARGEVQVSYTETLKYYSGASNTTE